MPPPQTLTGTCIAALIVHTWAMQPPGDPNSNPLPPQQHTPANGQPPGQPPTQQPPTSTQHHRYSPPEGHPHNPPQAPWLPPYVATMGPDFGHQPMAATSYVWQATHGSTGGTMITSWQRHSLVPQAGLQVGTPRRPPRSICHSRHT